jgi:hypothetical protein
LATATELLIINLIAQHDVQPDPIYESVGCVKCEVSIILHGDEAVVPRSPEKGLDFIAPTKARI